MEATPQSGPRPGTSSGSPQNVAREAASAAREQAGAIANEAKDNARSMFEDQQRAAASGLGDFAGALRRAAREMEGGQSAPVSRMAQSAADGLQRFSETLRSKDLDALLHEAESFARRQPVVFMGAAALAGFLAVRFLKSSRPATDYRGATDYRASTDARPGASAPDTRTPY